MTVYGASGHAKVIIDIIHSINGVIEFVYDKDPNISEICGYKVVHSTQETSRGKDAIVAIGNNKIRKKVAVSIEGGFSPFIAHSSAFISRNSEIGKGTVIMPQAAVNSGAIIGKHCIINTGAVVEHDVVLENFVHISPNAAIAGNVRIGEGSHIGTGASVIPGIKIGKWSTIGAGAVVIKDIPDNTTVVGNPGRIIHTAKELEE